MAGGGKPSLGGKGRQDAWEAGQRKTKKRKWENEGEGQWANAPVQFKFADRVCPALRCASEGSAHGGRERHLEGVGVGACVEAGSLRHVMQVPHRGWRAQVCEKRTLPLQVAGERARDLSVLHQLAVGRHAEARCRVSLPPVPGRAAVGERGVQGTRAVPWIL